MANPRICSVEGCGKGGKLRRGWCGLHYARWKAHGDPLYVVPKEERGKPGKKGPVKYAVDPDWFERVYHAQKRPLGEIAREIGCSVFHVKYLAKHFGLPARDGRAGRISHGQRVAFDLNRAAWLYEVQRMNCSDIGTELGLSGDTVRRRLRESGIRIRHQNETKRGAKARNRSKINERKVVSAYLADGGTIDTVADRFGTSRGVVRRILEENYVALKPLTIVRPNGGELNPNWRHDLTPEERERRRDTYKQAQWREAVYRRDAYACQRCHDDRGGNLHAHHIEGHSFSRARRWDVSNGITLCEDCHRGFHRTYGLKGFGAAELKEWIDGAVLSGASRGVGEEERSPHAGGL